MFENGCEWVRCDFHLHTRADKEFQYTGAENSFIKDYIQALETQKIKVGIITNHNKFDFGEYKALKKEGGKREIFILPGVELSVKEGRSGVHTLIVFNPDDWIKSGKEYINSFLEAAFQGVENRENENTRCNWDFNVLFSELEKLNRDYFIVFAHIEQDKGLIRECAGNILGDLAANVAFKKRVVGLQKLRTYDNKGKIQKWFGYEVAYVEGSDPKSVAEIGKGKVCYVKIGAYSFDALKFALKDYAYRVADNLVSNTRGYIESIEFKGGKLDSQKIPLSNELNTLIGIRGSGKSSILELIRYALALEADYDSKYKEDLIRNALGSGGEISLNIIDSQGKSYIIKRLLGEPVCIMDMNGNELGISTNSIINTPLYFGQKDLAATGEGYESKLLEKLMGNKLDEQFKNIDEIESRLIDLIAELLKVKSIPDEIVRLNTEKNDLEYKLKIYQDKGIDKKLEKQISYTTDQNTIQNLNRDIRNIYQSINKVYSDIDKKTLNLSEYISSYNKDLFKLVVDVSNKITNHIDKGLKEINEIPNLLTQLEKYENELQKNIQLLKDEFAEIKREISREITIDLNPDKYFDYKRKLNDIDRQILDLNKKNSGRDNLISQMQDAIAARDSCLYNIFNQCKEELDKINRSQGELEIKITFKSNKDKFKESIKEYFKGTGLTDDKFLKIVNTYDDSSSIISDCFFYNSNKLKEILTSSQVSKVCERIENSYADLIRIKCSDLVEINYHGKPLMQHSIGQRASALILFILAQGNNDLIIIDQPEDDLDNQVIYKELISTIKEKKNSIQFIFATHNANIPVLGDAESVIAAEYGESINLDVGNIDRKETHKRIVDIMEGGKEAFERRKLIYNHWHEV